MPVRRDRRMDVAANIPSSTALSGSASVPIRSMPPQRAIQAASHQPRARFSASSDLSPALAMDFK